MDKILNDFLNEDEISLKIKNILEKDVNIKDLVSSIMMENKKNSVESDEDTLSETNSENKAESIEKIVENKFLHPCKYCGNICKGKQCKQCHFKMMSRTHECTNCKNTFVALRCFTCQDSYNKNNISICPECGDSYVSVSKDGKVFDKCYKCNMTMFSKCQKCNRRCLKQYTYCKPCFEKMRNDNVDLPINNCKTVGCENTTQYVFCKDCYKNYNFVNKNQ